MSRSAVLSLGVFLISASLAQAQQATLPPTPATVEEGRPLVRVHRPREIGGGNQTWSFVQDARGVIYAGTNGAVLEFDGANWRRIGIGGVGSARSLAIDSAGRIFVGSANDFGYLAPDAHGALQFVSLKEKLPEADRDFNDVWRTWATPSGVYFQTERVIFKWVDDRLTLIRPASRFNRSSLVDGKVYLTTSEGGLNVLEGDTFRALPGTSALGGEPFPVLLRYDATRLLVGTRSNGLFLYDGNTLTRFPTELDSMFVGGQVYRGTLLSDGNFALTTTNAGLAIIDRDGRRVNRVDRNRGLPSNVVYYAMQDRDGALWLGMDSGLARVETPSPVSYFSSDDGIPGTVNNSIRHLGRLFVATQTSVSVLEPALGAEPARFVPIPGLNVQQCWWFAEMLDPAGTRPPTLAVACTSGLSEISATGGRPITDPRDLTYRTAVLLASKVDPTRLWVGMFDGFSSARLVNGQWTLEGRVDGITEQIRTIYEDSDGSLWLGTQAEGVLRVRFASRPQMGAPRPAATVERFGTAQGVPEGGVTVDRFGTMPIFAMGTTDPHVAFFDESTKRFVRERALDGVGVNPIQSNTTHAGWRRQPGLRQLGPRVGALRQARRWLVGGRSRHAGPLRAQRRCPWRVHRARRLLVDLGSRRPVHPIRHDPRGAADREVRRAHPASHRQPRSAALRRRRRGGPAQPRRLPHDAPLRVCRARLRRRERDGIPVEARRARVGLVGMEPRAEARLHERRPGQLPLPRACPQRPGTNQRRGVLRLHDPAAVVPHVAGLRRLHRAAGRAASSSPIACSAGVWWARSASVPDSRKRGCAPNRPRRWRARRAKARRTSSC